ncbi:MAG TPA: WD40 repeat domain-containing protein [Pyrinomonadaceae bacterium]|nr:WD40 repeat domain-containing protein [Pyrinomonadaceae bacterium]
MKEKLEPDAGQVSKEKLEPYVGPRPFSRADRSLFFGRDREANELLSLVVAHPVVLLYSQSGAGKTSLLNARIIPLLEKRGSEVFGTARVSGELPQGLQAAEVANIYVFNALLSLQAATPDPRALSGLTFEQFLKSRPYPEQPEGRSPLRVVIFDQFEEIFTTYPERWNDREGFFDQVGAALEVDRRLRVVFAMREEYLASMDPYVGVLPERARTRLRLERLREEAALLAVKKPLEGTDYSFAPGAAEKLVRNLLRVPTKSVTGTIDISGEFVEPVQLQVVCQNLWQSLPKDVSVVEEKNIETYGDVDAALTTYYEDSLRKATPLIGFRKGLLRGGRKGFLRHWFDTRLITSGGTRGTVYMQEETTGGLANTVVKLFENLHLIRAEMRGGAPWYELTHDRFIGPIRQSNRKWRSEMGYGLVGLLVILLLVGAPFLGYFIYSRYKAHERQQDAILEERGKEASRLAAQPGKQFDALVFGLKALDDNPEDSPPEAVEGLRTAVAGVGDALWLRRPAAVEQVGFSSDGGRALTISPDEICVWDAKTGELLFSTSGEAIPDDIVWRSAQLFHNDERVFVVGISKPNDAAKSSSQALVENMAAGIIMRAFDLQTRRPLDKLNGQFVNTIQVQFSEDGLRLLATGLDDRVRFMDSDGNVLSTLHDSRKNSTMRMMRMTFISSTGTRVVITTNDGSVQVWNTSTSTPLGLKNYKTTGSGSFVRPYISPDASRLVLLDYISGQDAILWDTDTGRELARLKPNFIKLFGAVGFSLDSRQFAALVSTKETDTSMLAPWGAIVDSHMIWDTQTGELISRHPIEIKNSKVISFDAATGIITLTKDHETNTFSVLQTPTFEKKDLLENIPGEIEDQDVSRDMSRIICRFKDNTVRLWDLNKERLSAGKLSPLELKTVACGQIRYQPEYTQVAEICAPMPTRGGEARQ